MNKLNLNLVNKLNKTINSSEIFTLSSRFNEDSNFLDNSLVILRHSASFINELKINNIVDYTNLLTHSNLIYNIIKKLLEIFEIDYKYLNDTSSFNIKDVRYQVDDVFFEMIYYNSIGYYNNYKANENKHLKTDKYNDINIPTISENGITLNRLVSNDNEIDISVKFRLDNLYSYVHKRFDLLNNIILKAKLLVRLHEINLSNTIIKYYDNPVDTLNSLIGHASNKFEKNELFNYLQELRILVSFDLINEIYEIFKKYINNEAKEFIKYYQKDDKKYLQTNFYLLKNNLIKEGYEKYEVYLGKTLDTLLWEVEYYDHSFYDFSDKNNIKIKEAFNILEQLNQKLDKKINLKGQINEIWLQVYLVLFDDYLKKELNYEKN